jgi:hypothetical protein
MKNIPTPIAILVIVVVIVVVVLVGLWYLNRSSPTPVGGIETSPRPVTPGGVQPGQSGQQGGQPVTPTY